METDTHKAVNWDLPLWRVSDGAAVQAIRPERVGLRGQYRLVEIQDPAGHAGKGWSARGEADRDHWAYTESGMCAHMPESLRLTNDITETEGYEPPEDVGELVWDPKTRRFLPKDVHRVSFGALSNPDLQPAPQRVDWYGAGDIEAEMEPEFLSLDWLLDLHEETCRAGRLTMARKNHDYTNGSTDIFANFEGSTIFGIHPVHGILLRTTDKLKRIETFVSKGELAVAGEGVDDAIEDAINYLVLIKGLIRKAQGE